jgi:hypothetical protein
VVQINGPVDTYVDVWVNRTVHTIVVTISFHLGSMLLVILVLKYLDFLVNISTVYQTHLRRKPPSLHLGPDRCTDNSFLRE